MWPVQPSRALAALIAVGVIPLGIGAEWVAYDASPVRTWGADLAVGWGLVVLGLAGRRVASDSPCGSLLCASGYAWFVGNFQGVDASLISWLAGHGAYVHRALIAHAIVTFPPAYPARPLRRTVVVGTYVAAVVPALATSDLVLLGVATAVVLVSTARPATIPAAFAFGGALTLPAIDRLTRSTTYEGTPVVYEVGLLASAALLVVALARRAWSDEVTNRVVELGETMTVREALRQVLADPRLEIAFAGSHGYVDEHGSPVAIDPKLAVTQVGRDGDLALVHGRQTSIDERTAEELSVALRLIMENANLRSDERRQVSDLDASHRRLAAERSRQRAQFSRELQTSIAPKVERIATALVGLRPASPALASAIAAAGARLEEIDATMSALAQGLRPPALAQLGLAQAVQALAADSPVPVLVRIEELRFDPEIERACYLACAEALANVAKHSGATKASVRVAAVGPWIQLEISDNGRGGASLTSRGLRGLADRFEELGGTLEIEGRAGFGTKILGRLPAGLPERSAGYDPTTAPHLQTLELLPTSAWLESH